MGTRTTGTSGSPSNKINDGHLIEYFNSQFQSKTGHSGVQPAGPIALEATGGVTNEYSDPTGDIWRSHTFTNTGTFTVTDIPAGAPGGPGAAGNHPDVPVLD